MGDEQLIDLVKQYKVIYNMKCVEYRDTSLRNAAWEEISKRHGKTVEECKENWNKLRNCYNNAMKRRQYKYGQPGKMIPPWRFEDQMTFLKPHLGGRHSQGNLDTVSNEDSPVSSPESTYFTYAEDQISPESIPSRSSTPTLNTSYKRKAISSCDFAEMIEVIKRSHENRQEILEMDDLDTFFLSMSKMVKTLPKLDQIRIKMELFKTINEAELKQLESQ